MEVTYLGHESEEQLIQAICSANNWDRKKIVRRSMFSTFQYYLNGVVFLKVYKNVIFLRISSETIPLWSKMGSQPCPNINAPKGFKPSKPTSLTDLASRPSTHPSTVKTSNSQYTVGSRDYWHSVPATLDHIDTLSAAVLDSYLQNMVIVQERKRITKIRDLPNISLSLCRMLKGAGINSLSSFKKLGYLEAFERVKLKYPTAGNDCLLSFYGALNSVHYCAIPPEKRTEIVQEYHNYIACSDSITVSDVEGDLCANA